MPAISPMSCWRSVLLFVSYWMRIAYGFGIAFVFCLTPECFSADGRASELAMAALPAFQVNLEKLACANFNMTTEIKDSPDGSITLKVDRGCEYLLIAIAISAGLLSICTDRHMRSGKFVVDVLVTYTKHCITTEAICCRQVAQ